MEGLSLTVSAYREHSLMSHSIQHYAKQWEKNAQQDPLWAILTNDRYAGGTWSLDDFFATGEKEIRLIFDYMRQSLEVFLNKFSGRVAWRKLGQYQLIRKSPLI